MYTRTSLLVASLTLVGATLASESPARADPTGTAVGAFYGGSLLTGSITMVGTSFALQTESRDALRGWGVASAVTATVNGGWSGFLLYVGGLHCEPGSLSCAVNDVALVGGVVSLTVALPNLALSIAALVHADGLKPFRESRVSFSPITMKAIQGPPGQGLSVSGVF